ncbi:MAG: hypothetical protein AB7F50_05480 [Fimbriimonadaceae bacterium]
MLSSAVILALIGWTGPTLTATYSHHEEVRCLRVQEGTLVAGTGGGLLTLGAQGWAEVAPRVPCTVVRYEDDAITTPSGVVMRIQGSEWRPSGRAALQPSSDSVACTTPDGTVVSTLGSRVLAFDDGSSCPAPEAENVYALAWHAGALWAGTSDGLWRRGPGGWVREHLPSILPTQRLHGLAILTRSWLVGGPEGLWDGSPGTWRLLDSRPVRQVVTHAGSAWVLFGDGSTDKLDLAADKRYDAVLHGAVKRPWSSTLAAGDSLLFGGMGGWVEKSSSRTTEKRPEWLQGAVVTALVASSGDTFVGTQSSGVYRLAKGTVRNISLLEGLEDTWATALAEVAGTVYIGTSQGGLSRISGDKALPVQAPTRSINHMVVWRGSLAIGGNDGAWLSVNGRWIRIGPEATETTGLAIAAGGLFVLTPYGTYRYD